MWKIVVYDGTAGLFLAMGIALLQQLRWVRRLPPLELGPEPDGRDCGGVRVRCSVVIAARDEAARIERTLRQLLQQRGVDLEIIVVDDRSAKNYFAAIDYRLGLALGGIAAVVVISVILGLGLASGTPAGIVAGLSPLAIVPAGVILARRIGWSWPCAVWMPFMFPVLMYALLNSLVVTLRQGGIRWRETFYPLKDLRAGNVQ